MRFIENLKSIHGGKIYLPIENQGLIKSASMKKDT